MTEEAEITRGPGQELPDWYQSLRELDQREALKYYEEFSGEIPGLMEAGDNLAEGTKSRLAWVCVQERLRAARDFTGLLRKEEFVRRFGQELARAIRGGNKVGVVIMDYDGFKQVNDRLGHTVGDQVLIQTAMMLLATIRGEDTAFHWGGDEFVLVAPEIDKEGFEALIGRIKNGVSNLHRELNLPYELGVTAGTILWEPPDKPAREIGKNEREVMAEEVFNTVDQKMRESKEEKKKG